MRSTTGRAISTIRTVVYRLNWIAKSCQQRRQLLISIALITVNWNRMRSMRVRYTGTRCIFRSFSALSTGREGDMRYSTAVGIFLK